ncbi:hypothetical protein [Pyxidicoccus xibeiensis]|uniref:hypothetical protein n=1 Tax=Pyxidicoccus xibeiensis TaxID=2906759 RepID=UPI0020A834E2|nr:hypothetical protein [Pyxidicoccus xibeiensis]MCP3138266.1 hypothetical protein [Pyxidicoccus xibeiensis]
MTALATGADSLQRKALISGGVAFGMFNLGWVWVAIAASASAGDRAFFLPLALLAAIQTVAGFRGLISTVQARKQQEMGLGLALVWGCGSLLLGVLGLVGVPLFLLLQSGGVKLGITH